MKPSPPDDRSSLPSGLDPAALAELQSGARELGIPLTPEMLAQFEIYYRELVTWNDKFNLTAITDRREVQIKHFLDCLSGLPLVLAELSLALPLERSLHLVDVGSGAGFPGIPLKIVAPRLKLTLMDGTGKKIQFLNELRAKLGLKHAQTVQGRAEELGRQPAFRGQFDLVTARAVAPLNILAEYLLPLVRADGLAFIYKGAGASEELMEARRAIELLGGETVRAAPVQVPFLEAERTIILIRKVRPTPALYPRGQGLARKKPLS